MAYKCLKCGCEETYPLKTQKFSAEAVIHKDINEEPAFEIRVEDADTIINCKKCDNFGLPSDRTKFSIVSDK